jgi:hypothetical protein
MTALFSQHRGEITKKLYSILVFAWKFYESFVVNEELNYLKIYLFFFINK